MCGCVCVCVLVSVREPGFKTHCITYMVREARRLLAQGIPLYCGVEGLINSCNSDGLCSSRRKLLRHLSLVKILRTCVRTTERLGNMRHYVVVPGFCLQRYKRCRHRPLSSRNCLAQCGRLGKGTQQSMRKRLAVAELKTLPPAVGQVIPKPRSNSLLQNWSRVNQITQLNWNLGKMKERSSKVWGALAMVTALA